MLFCKKRDYNDKTPLKQEIFEDVLYTNTILEKVCITEAVIIGILIIGIILRVVL